MFSEKRVLVFIIAFNEEETIEHAIKDIRTHAPYADIIVVDDCSTDETANIARNCGVVVISHAINSQTPGYAAVKTAFMYAKMQNYDICCQFDGDGQHDAAYLGLLLAPVVEGRADMVIGSRFLEENTYASSRWRRLGIHIFSAITSIIIGKRIYDITSGFKANGRKIIDLFSTYPHMLTDTNEMIVLARRCGARIEEVPVEMHSRERGRSWFTFTKGFLYPLRALLSILAVLIREYNSKERV